MTDSTSPVPSRGGIANRGGVQPPSVVSTTLRSIPVGRVVEEPPFAEHPRGAAVSAPRGAEAPRKVGAPPGNNNALKHGFYSHSFTKSDLKRLEQNVQGELFDEEELIRLLIDYAVNSMKDEKMNHDRYIVALRAVSLALGRIESIHRSRKAIYDNTTSLDKVWEELKYLPFEED